MIEKYCKDSVKIKAVQLTGDNDNIKEIISFINGKTLITDYAKSSSAELRNRFDEYCDMVRASGICIGTKEGTIVANVGDWIIQDDNGEFSFCKSDNFEKMYKKLNY